MSASEYLAANSERQGERRLRLPYECLRSIPEGINEVRVWHDQILECDRVGKRIDISSLEGDDALPEPATLQSIKHKNVVPIIAAAEVEGFPPPMRVVEIITPYFERGSITDALLRGESFAASEAVAITQAILRGLAQIHEVHKICHRDMKSGNVLLCPDYRARVADLGLAGRFDDQGEVAALNNPTLYSPFEFARTKRLSRASDLYAVGLVFRELIGGAFPYAKYPMSLVVERLAAGKSPLYAADLQLPIWATRSMRRVYSKATHRDAGQRFQTAQEMDEALASVIAVDWVEVEPNRWEAPFVHGGRRIAVEARPATRLGGFRLRIQTYAGRGWRRTGQVVDVSDLTGSAARKVFDQASTMARVR
ncbi:protein kinase [Kribbella sp. NBC_01505]|uniref:protein kinase domain-containing protein n=1 Tax=Kribbella sp. NBC_01505 TaxID=2903580 RepID=UPI003865450A